MPGTAPRASHAFSHSVFVKLHKVGIIIISIFEMKSLQLEVWTSWPEVGWLVAGRAELEPRQRRALSAMMAAEMTLGSSKCPRPGLPHIQITWEPLKITHD